MTAIETARAIFRVLNSAPIEGRQLGDWLTLGVAFMTQSEKGYVIGLLKFKDLDNLGEFVENFAAEIAIFSQNMMEKS